MEAQFVLDAFTLGADCFCFNYAYQWSVTHLPNPERHDSVFLLYLDMLACLLNLFQTYHLADERQFQMRAWVIMITLLPVFEFLCGRCVLGTSSSIKAFATLQSE